MEPKALYRRIAQRHILMSDAVFELHSLLIAQGEDIALLSESLDDNPVEPSNETEPCPPPEMAVHAPSTVPPEPERPSKRRNDMTAKEWAEGMPFLEYVKRHPTFSKWSAEEQAQARDRFAAAMPKDKTQARWGKTFAKFVGVSE